MNTKRKSLFERIVSKVNTKGPVPLHNRQLGNCWLWTGTLKAHAPAQQTVSDIKRGKIWAKALKVEGAK